MKNEISDKGLEKYETSDSEKSKPKEWAKMRPTTEWLGTIKLAKAKDKSERQLAKEWAKMRPADFLGKAEIKDSEKIIPKTVKATCAFLLISTQKLCKGIHNNIKGFNGEDEHNKKNHKIIQNLVEGFEASKIPHNEENVEDLIEAIQQGIVDVDYEKKVEGLGKPGYNHYLRCGEIVTALAWVLESMHEEMIE